MIRQRSRSRSTPSPCPHTGLDLARLRVLTDRDLDAAEEEGACGGNGEYQDLQACTLEDLRDVLACETAAIAAVRAAVDPASAEAEEKSRRPVGDELAARWHLDLGVAGAVVALVVLNAHPVLSCNGGAFGRPHGFDAPLIRFYLAAAGLETLGRLVRLSGAHLGQYDGQLVLHAADIDVFAHFATQVLAEADRGLPPGC